MERKDENVIPAGAARSRAVPDDPEQVVDEVRDRYGRIATGQEPGCCGPRQVESTVAIGIGYDAGDLKDAPEGANLGLGCGAPIPFLGLAPGETVLDLGSGPGLDAILAARQVGPTGRVIGVDMTPAMIERARAAAAGAGLSQVEFREGRLEDLPVDDASVDAVTSNCAINLVPDKGAVFREVARVLRPGGRIVVSDIVLVGRLPEALERDILAYVGCIAGARQRDAYLEMIAAAGLADIEVLRDVDYLATSGTCLPEDLREPMAASGVTAADLAGKVRSLTVRAVRPARH